MLDSQFVQTNIFQMLLICTISDIYWGLARAIVWSQLLLIYYNVLNVLQGNNVVVYINKVRQAAGSSLFSYWETICSVPFTVQIMTHHKYNCLSKNELDCS